MKLFSHKKGLELPITAIVVLIISITFLGLVLFFIKSIFGGGTTLLQQELAKIQSQLIDNMKASGKLFAMSEGAQMELKTGESKQFHIAVRNTAPKDVCYRAAVRCLKAFTPDNHCSPSGNSGTEGILVGGVEPDGATRPTKGDNWVPKLLSEMEISGSEVYVSPVTLQVAGGVKADTYLMEFDIYKELNDNDCKTASNWPTAEEPYQRERFHIIVS